MIDTSKLQRLQRIDGRVEIICPHGCGHTTTKSAAALDKKYGHKKGTWKIHGCDINPETGKPCCADFEECQ